MLRQMLSINNNAEIPHGGHLALVRPHLWSTGEHNKSMLFREQNDMDIPFLFLDRSKRAIPDGL
jgi:hypothetical protein